MRTAHHHRCIASALQMSRTPPRFGPSRIDRPTPHRRREPRSSGNPLRQTARRYEARRHAPGSPRQPICRRRRRASHRPPDTSVSCKDRTDGLGKLLSRLANLPGTYARNNGSPVSAGSTPTAPDAGHSKSTACWRSGPPAARSTRSRRETRPDGGEPRHIDAVASSTSPHINFASAPDAAAK